MLPVDTIPKEQLHDVQRAVAYIFSPEKANDIQFVRNLDPGVIKAAYREKVMRYHPDVNQEDDVELAERRIKRFRDIQSSYQTLLRCFDEGESPDVRENPRFARTIAVGGAKGGIGKSIFAANLAVYLSSLGKKTVIADLDLGGANLHLYLGEKMLPRKVNDFLNTRAVSLADIMIANTYGPLLIGGDSSQLGAANINFGRKLKLLNALKSVEADYVIFDLGGDTTYNIIDFFLAADDGIVVTTEDPASYLEAYRFIKVSLLRKLNRLFGREVKGAHPADEDLKQLIFDATMSQNGIQVKTIEELLERVRTTMPMSYATVLEAVNTFRPRLVVNRVPPDRDANRIVTHIRSIARKMLSVEVGYLGKISQLDEVEESARNLVPAVSKRPAGTLAKEVAFIANALLAL